MIKFNHKGNQTAGWKMAGNYQLILEFGQYKIFSDADKKQIKKFDVLKGKTAEYRLVAADFISFLDEINLYHQALDPNRFLKQLDDRYLNLGNLIIR